MNYAHITGWGSYLPEQVLTNEEIARTINTTDAWIRQRTGIGQRRIAASRETTAGLAIRAAVQALEVACLPPADVELIIVATSTPDYIFPSTACQVQGYLNATRAGAFDLSAACSGFVYALHMATQAIATGSAGNALVIGAEMMSRVLDWQDRGTCVLFGDGAGAVVLQGSSRPGGVLASKLRSDGLQSDILCLSAAYNSPLPAVNSENGHARPVQNTISMNGRRVFRFATSVLVESVQDVLAMTRLRLDEIALIVPHQANFRILESAAKQLNVSPELFYTNLEDTGNTSAASIPVALCKAIQDGRIHPGNHLILVGFGGGLTWAYALVKWQQDITSKYTPTTTHVPFARNDVSGWHQ